MESIYSLSVDTLHGVSTSMMNYKNKVLLIVNIASECGFTPQLGELERLYKTYNNQNFEILGFPSNQFLNQEPLEGAEISRFCQKNYGVTFPVFKKVKVKGDEAIPLYKFLSSKKKNGKVNISPKWNFHKYLIDRNGYVVDYFFPITKPMAPKIRRAIDRLLE